MARIVTMQTSDIQAFIKYWETGVGDIEAHTSGSTGTPKRIMLPRRLVRESALRSIRHFGLDRESVIHLMLSPSYIAGKMAIIRALEAGCTLTCEEPSAHPLSSPDTPPHITLLSAVGAQIAGMQALKEEGKLPHISHLLLGGAPLRPDMRKVAVTLADEVWESYGMTETASHIALRRVSARDPEGTAPFVTLEGISVATDERGCLVITMPTAGRIVTNDLAEVLDSNSFRVLGRVDNVIITGGLKVMPERVEQALAPLMAGRAYYVSSRPHAKWGEELVLVAENADNEDIKHIDIKQYFIAGKSLAEHCGELLAPHERPKCVITLPELDRTSSGKIIRRKF